MREFGSNFSMLAGDFPFGGLYSQKGFSTMRSCRDALGYLAKLLKKPRGNVLYLPALCCESMFRPFEHRGYEIRFYDVNSDLSPVEKTFDEAEDIFFCMDFFGENDCSAILKRIKSVRPQITTILDLTHVPYDDLWNIPEADFCVASLRKTYPIVNGGILYSAAHELTDVPTYRENNFTSLTSEALAAKERYRTDGLQERKAVYRKLFTQAETELGNGEISIAACPQSLEQIRKLDAASLKTARKNNFRTLRNSLKNNASVKFLCSDVTARATPFSLPVAVDDRDRVRSELEHCGLYLAVYWPLDRRAREISRVAAEFESKMLSLPVDQRYGIEDMKDIAAIVNKVTNVK